MTWRKFDILADGGNVGGYIYRLPVSSKCDFSVDDSGAIAGRTHGVWWVQTPYGKSPG